MVGISPPMNGMGGNPEVRTNCPWLRKSAIVNRTLRFTPPFLHIPGRSVLAPRKNNAGSFCLEFHFYNQLANSG
jgi:hypothetical protein